MSKQLYCVKIGCKAVAVDPLTTGGLATFCLEHSPGIVAGEEELLEAIAHNVSTKTEAGGDDVETGDQRGPENG